MVALAAAYPFIFIKASLRATLLLHNVKLCCHCMPVHSGDCDIACRSGQLRLSYSAVTSHSTHKACMNQACIMLQDIPRLQWSQRNEARRFVTLLDTLYDMRCLLQCSAAGKPNQVPVTTHASACCSLVVHLASAMHYLQVLPCLCTFGVCCQDVPVHNLTHLCNYVRMLFNRYKRHATV